jgi:hypothetical protein
LELWQDWAAYKLGLLSSESQFLQVTVISLETDRNFIIKRDKCQQTDLSGISVSVDTSTWSWIFCMGKLVHLHGWENEEGIFWIIRICGSP